MAAQKHVVAYLKPSTRDWLDGYATSLNTSRSEILRFLVERERQVKFIKWVMEHPDPLQKSAPATMAIPDKLPKSPRHLQNRKTRT